MGYVISHPTIRTNDAFGYLDHITKDPPIRISSYQDILSKVHVIGS